MSTTPARLPTPAAETLPATLAAAAEQAAYYAAQALSPATRRAYARDWADFVAWAHESGVSALPALPAAVGSFLAQRSASLAVVSLGRRLAAIATRHRMAGLEFDTRHAAIRAVMQGIRRSKGVASLRRARATTTPALLAMVHTCDETLIGMRDKALLLVGFASALRRSELTALTVQDLEFSVEGVCLHIRRSKTDQQGVGDVVGILASGSPTCPVAALRRWIQAASIGDGPVFRRVDRHQKIGTNLSGESVALIVRRRATLANLEAAQWSAHSLRSGLATAAAAAGIAEADIQRQTRHKSVAVLRTYVRHGSVFIRNASSILNS